MQSAFPSLTVPSEGSGLAPTLGHRLVDEYLESVHARLRPNSALAVVYDLKVFFDVVVKDPLEVRRRDVMEFIRAQRTGSPARNVAAIGESDGLALSTIRRRLSSVAGFYSHLVAVGEMDHNRVQRGMPVRSPVHRDRRVVPLVRPARHLPRILDHDEVHALVGALRTDRDRAMIDAMLLGGLRRCEVLGLRHQDIRWGERRLFIVDGKGGHQRIVPISPRFFDKLRSYLDDERPAEAETSFVFVVLKGPNRGRPLKANGLDQIMLGARQRAGLDHATCHELRHTCFTRLREAGMALEALQASSTPPASQRSAAKPVHRSDVVDQRTASCDQPAFDRGALGGRFDRRGRNQSAIGALVERVTRYTRLVHMDGRSNADDFAASLAVTYATLPPWMRESLTWDQGVEMASHAGFTEASGIAVYFCDPRSPWQRGTNENTNGLLRQYFPKHTDLGIYTQADLRAVEHELNHRPRKILGWQSPAERLATLADTHRVATTP